MKILIIGHLYGNLDIINQYIDKSQCDCVLCAGDIGISSRTQKPSHQFKFPKWQSNFYEYLEGRKKFNKPIIAVAGTYEDYSLVKKLWTREFYIDNFYLLRSGEICTQNKIRIGGLSGSYSPIAYRNELKANQGNHIYYEQVDKLKNNIDILLLYDLIGKYKKKSINFSDESLDLFIKSNCIYSIIGRYSWWGCANLPGRNILILPKAIQGYLMIDTDGWNIEGVRFDLTI